MAEDETLQPELPRFASGFEPLDLMLARVRSEGADSPSARFDLLVNTHEYVLKLATAALLAAVEDEREGHRYRIAHSLVRANGAGLWEANLTEILTGPPNQYLLQNAWEDAEEISGTVGTSEPGWRTQALKNLASVCRRIDPRQPELPRRTNLLTWFRLGIWLRNQRAHRPLPAALRAALVEELADAIYPVTQNLRVFKRSWAVLRRTYSGKHHVVPVGGDPRPFDYLKSAGAELLDDGVYVFYGGPLRAGLFFSDVEKSDFFLPNGDLRKGTFEGVSYVTGATVRIDATPYRPEPSPMAKSETHGLDELDVQGDAFGNVPPITDGYVRRAELERELEERLGDDRYPVITLVGRGGIGKTSLAIRVLHTLAAQHRFEAVVWFSARDVELDVDRPKTVKPQVKALEEIASEFARLMDPSERAEKDFNALQYLADCMQSVGGIGRILWVFDNFETVAHPAEIYERISNWVRLPNKVLITTRMRPFKGDYPVEVLGMSTGELDELISVHAIRLGIAQALTADLRKGLHTESEGHPYVAKILLGELARSGVPPKVERVMAGREDVLAALFERTYSSLSPTAQRAFLILCNWRSFVSVTALQAVLLRPTNERPDLDEAIGSLVITSMVDIHTSEDGEEFLSVPLYAAMFGRSRLQVSPLESAVRADTRLLQLFGVTRASDLPRGLGPRVDTLFRSVAEILSSHTRDEATSRLADYLPILEYVAGRYAVGWLRLAELHVLVDPINGVGPATEAVERYLQTQPEDEEAWRRLATLARRGGDGLTEVNALIKRAERKDAPLDDISFAANRFNQLLSEKRLTLDTIEKRVMAERLRTVFEARVRQADATDLSRLAWLCLHLRDMRMAEAYAKQGIGREPDNEFCRSLLRRLAKKVD